MSEPDEERFLDRESLIGMVTEEPIVTMDGSTSNEVRA